MDVNYDEYEIRCNAKIYGEPSNDGIAVVWWEGHAYADDFSWDIETVTNFDSNYKWFPIDQYPECEVPFCETATSYELTEDGLYEIINGNKTQVDDVFDHTLFWGGTFIKLLRARKKYGFGKGIITKITDDYLAKKKIFDKYAEGQTKAEVEEFIALFPVYTYEELKAILEAKVKEYEQKYSE